MAEGLVLANELLVALAAQIATAPIAGLEERELASREIGESFPVWVLEEGSIDADQLSISELARPTQIVHHQINSGAGSIQHVRSISDEDGLHFAGIFTTSLSQNINRAIDIIDREKPDDTATARLLEVPSRAVSALWIVENSSSQYVVVRRLVSEIDFALIDEATLIDIIRSDAATYRING